MNDFFFYSNNAPDAIVVLNRRTDFENDISADVISLNCNNDIGGFGNFNITIDNTNDKHVDRYGKYDVPLMSSIEIFTKTNIAYANKSPKWTYDTVAIVKEGQTIKDIIYDTYDLYSLGPTDDLTEIRNKYLTEVILKNPNLKLANGNLINSSNATVWSEKLASGQRINMPPRKTKYKRIFLGVVLTVSQNFSAGSNMTIQLTGESYGWWLKASMVNVRPAVAEMGQSSATQLSWSMNKFVDLKALDIFKELIKFSTNDTVTVQDLTLGSLTTSYENPQGGGFSDVFTDDLDENIFIGNNVLTLKDALENNKINPPENQSSIEKIGALNELQERINRGYLVTGISINSDQLKSSESNSVKDYRKLSKQYIEAADLLESTSTKASATMRKNSKIRSVNGKESPSGKKASESDGNINKKLKTCKTNKENILKELRKNSIYLEQTSIIDKMNETLRKKHNLSNITKGRKLLENLGIMQRWQEIFADIVLEVANASFLNNVYPLKIMLGTPSIIDGDYISKADLSNQIAKALMFEFYVDTNGHFVLKPPFYNIDIPDDDPTYIIEQEDLISMGINETVEGIVTRVGVVGDTRLPVQLVKEQTYNVHVDLSLIKKYGVHSRELGNAIFLKTAQDCRDFGEAYMAKNNQELNSAQVTVLGRPDIRLGVACYLKPRDTVYYIKGISHDFNVGESFTTTLTLMGARKIITGFRAVSKINTITKNNIGGIQIIEKFPGRTTIQHYVPANSTKMQEIMTNKGIDNISKDSEKTIDVIKNSVIIVSHPNPGYVGLILDNKSYILSDISKNALVYIKKSLNKTLNTVNVLKNAYERLQSQFGKDNKPFEIINNSFDSFLQKNKIEIELDDNGTVVKEKNINLFTPAKLQEFFIEFINSTQAMCKALRKANNINELETYQAANQYFNVMINNVEVVGDYRPYTDSDGREYPVTLNYGRGLKIEGSEIGLKARTPDQISSNKEALTNSEVDKIISIGKQNASYNSSQKTKDIRSGDSTPSQGTTR